MAGPGMKGERRQSPETREEEKKPPLKKCVTSKDLSKGNKEEDGKR